jgi:hypothetical protein
MESISELAAGPIAPTVIEPDATYIANILPVSNQHLECSNNSILIIQLLSMYLLIVSNPIL